MKDILIIAAVVVILALAIGYVIRTKKKGATCIGCPARTGSGCSGCSGCNSLHE